MRDAIPPVRDRYPWGDGRSGRRDPDGVWAALYLDCYTERVSGGSAGLLGGLVVAGSFRLQDQYAVMGILAGGIGGLVGDLVGRLDPLLAHGQRESGREHP